LTCSDKDHILVSCCPEFTFCGPYQLGAYCCPTCTYSREGSAIEWELTSR
jgi:hypothetical protein